MSFDTGRRRLLGAWPGIALLAAAPGAARAQGGHAHSHAQHGGQAQRIGRYEAELALRGPELSLYLLDDNDRPVDAAGLTATAQVLARGNQQRLAELRPAGGNRLAARLDFEVEGRLRATVTLRQAGGAEIGRGRYAFDPPR